MSDRVPEMKLLMRILFSYANHEYKFYSGCSPPFESYLWDRFEIEETAASDILKTLCYEGLISGKTSPVFEVNVPEILTKYGVPNISSSLVIRKQIDVSRDTDTVQKLRQNSHRDPVSILSTIVSNTSGSYSDLSESQSHKFAARTVDQSQPKEKTPAETSRGVQSKVVDVTDSSLVDDSDDFSPPLDFQGNQVFLNRTKEIEKVLTDELNPNRTWVDPHGRKYNKRLLFPEKYRKPGTHELVGVHSIDLLGVNQTYAVFGQLVYMTGKPNENGDAGRYNVQMAFKWKDETLDAVCFPDNKQEYDAFAAKLSLQSYYLIKGYRVVKPKFPKEFLTNTDVGLRISVLSHIDHLKVTDCYQENSRITETDKTFNRSLGVADYSPAKKRRQEPGFFQKAAILSNLPDPQQKLDTFVTRGQTSGEQLSDEQVQEYHPEDSLGPRDPDDPLSCMRPDSPPSPSAEDGEMLDHLMSTLPDPESPRTSEGRDSTEIVFDKPDSEQDAADTLLGEEQIKTEPDTRYLLYLVL